MRLLVYTKSSSFADYLSSQLELRFELYHQLPPLLHNGDRIHLIHASSYTDTLSRWLETHSSAANVKLAVCADHPQVGQMLQLAQLGVRAYCNSHMRGPLYQQMLQMLEQGQSWFPPNLLQQTFDLARNAIADSDSTQSNSNRLLAGLTDREKQTALAVSRGLSNRAIAEEFNIAERTVKSHLTSIFKKLKLKDRVALLLYLKQA